MSYEQRDGSGALFKNDKGDNAARPDYRGDLRLNGVDYELAAWLKDGKKGKFMSLSAKPKGDKERSAPKSEPARPSPDDFDDDIPF